MSMFSLPRLFFRNLVYHWRGNLAVMLGVTVGAAILTGALLVGDSLRGSLRTRVERQLCGIDFAARFPRALRADIADDLPGRVSPTLLLPGTLQAGSDSTIRFLGRVTVIGVDDRFQPAGAEAIDWTSADRQIALSHRVASRSGVGVGDTVTLGVERFSDLPRSSAVARRGAADATATAEYRVAAILPIDSSANEFNLSPSPALPLNVFVPIRALSRLVSDEREPVANTLLASGGSASQLNASLRDRLRIEDYGIRIREIDRKGYLSVESDQLILPASTTGAIQNAVKELGWRSEPTIAYIADALGFGERQIPYPVIAALNPNARAPLGPFLPPGTPALDDDEIVLLEWPGSELNGLPPGSKIHLSFFSPDVEGTGELKRAEMTLRGYLPLKGAADDRDLVPEIRGVTDPRANLHDWDRPPVLPKEQIRARVPDKPPHPRGTFFNAHKATPMAYMNLATGRKLFSGRYGSDTSIRIAPPKEDSLERSGETLRHAVLKHLDPASAGLSFEPVRERLMVASGGGTDFGGLFLGFSFFLIVSALVLVGLLFRLALDRRGKEVGLLLTLGFRARKLQLLLLAEGLFLAIVGACVGIVLAVLYDRMLLRLLVDLWPDPEVAGYLRPHSTPASFGVGFVATIVMCVAAVWLSARGLVKVSPPALLRGETQPVTVPVRKRSTAFSWLWIACTVVGIALVLAGRDISNPDYRAMTFLVGGGLCLIAGLLATWTWMRRTRHRTIGGRRLPALTQLGTRNAARNPVRSILTTALLASAAFLLVAVESFRRQPGNDFLAQTGGSGGFNLIAECDVPLFQTFADPLGRKELQSQLETFSGQSRPAGLEAQGIQALATAAVFPLRLRDGDDASCMNLFQASRPRILGVPRALIDRGGFKFYDPSTSSLDETRRTWMRLLEPQPDGAIPVFCEQNTAQWMLKTPVGGVISIPGDRGDELRLRIVATFVDSPFQSELLMAEDFFTKAFPSTSGFRTFLIQVVPEEVEAVSHVLSVGYRANGMLVTPTRERVAAYQAVVGAYLTTFQLLGGLGLLLGILGLAVVVLRGVWERVGELALLRAVGYRRREVQILLIAENALLLLLGLAIGVAAASLSVAPHIAEGAAVPWFRLISILALVLAVGLGVASAATAGILRVPVIPALRHE
jgi:ABC-type antimicrobial peptide transport system permease subunit